MIKRWFVVLLVAIGVFGGFGYYKYQEIMGAMQAAEDQPEYSETVMARQPEPATYTPTVSALGVALAPQKVTLRNELAGYITAVNFPSGARVKKGDVLIQLDISEQQANLTSAKARIKLAKSLYNRAVQLKKNNIVSEEKVDQVLSELTVQQANIKAIESIINRRTIRAPFDGVIGIHQFEEGQYLDANTVITTLIGESEAMWVDFSLPQFYGELALGTVLTGRMVRAGELGQPPAFDATIIAGDSQISTAARSRLYRAVVQEPSENLRHNASLEIRVPVGQSQAVQSIPLDAIRSDLAGKYLFVLDQQPDGQSYRARRVPVVIKRESGGVAYFTSSVTEQDLVATVGSFKLSPGLLVYVNNDAKVPTDEGYS
ncbi:efflux RND transporter periplasmic adaptor subunit [Rhodovibrionaceae bacterium A322]